MVKKHQNPSQNCKKSKKIRKYDLETYKNVKNSDKNVKENDGIVYKIFEVNAQFRNET